MNMPVYTASLAYLLPEHGNFIVQETYVSCYIPRPLWCPEKQLVACIVLQYTHGFFLHKTVMHAPKVCVSLVGNYRRNHRT